MQRQLQEGQSLGNLCLVAGGSLMLAAVLYIWAFVAQTVLPAPSSDAASVTLSFIAQYSSVFTLSYALFAAANALSIVGAMGVYVALRAVEKSYAALGAGILALGLTAALFSTTGFALVSLAKDYASAPTEADKQIFATAAAGVSSTNEPIISSTLIGVGVIFVSLAILRGKSERWLVYLGFAAGALNIIRDLPYFVNYFILTEVFVLLSAVWIFGTGRLVYRQAGRA